METTDKYSCQMLVQLLVAHGVKHVVMSPGSRNLPLMVAVSRSDELKSTVVVDERIAAFMALGMASASCAPVALVCTSGTALLNYAPAVAEAYYKHVPLIVVSADRPYQWIDQDDSQTIRQNGVLANIVKRSCDIPDVASTKVDRWYAGRVINDVLIEMMRGCPGPVHINVQLAEPLNVMTDSVQQAKVVRNLVPVNELPSDRAVELAHYVASVPKVMIVAGFLSLECAGAINRNLAELNRQDNVIVLTESISNLKIERAIECIDIAVSGIPCGEESDYAPELLITVGGALVSRFVKQFLRNYPPKAHWHVGQTDSLIDCMQAMT
ncbi:MAG: 2-succinyl-5-enolpyruvyl-6-hydroxy-3-cyclohexene-1-carboxylic-acid synthase, partial [Muribaculaceae bacterium]|nr:2-succinyl-5-enolpyruvyl-6-hydroxy-3-cyclohexene-1-carboxylic-acid synthase [Muribaculaceae bacterium]